MKTFEVEVQEVLAQIVKVKANNEAEALDMVIAMYKNEEVVLDAGDFVSHSIQNLPI